MQDVEDSATHRFWESQHSSRHARDDDTFFEQKAQEHAGIMRADDRERPVADFACGAGELLSHFIKFVKVEEASDYSESMLDKARQRLAGGTVELIHVDGLTHAQRANSPVWTTCGGINQYLDPTQLRQWMGTFAANAETTGMYLFDCVDPYRYRSLRDQSRFRDPLPTSPRYRLRARAWRVKNYCQNVRRQGWANLGRASMGFGYSPSFIRAVCHDLGLDVEFSSSRFYEYRFHAIISKPQ